MTNNGNILILIRISQIILVSLMLNFNVTHSAKILCVFPVPSVSHQVVFRSLTQALANKGHEVTVITTDPAFPEDKGPPNLTEIDVHDESYLAWQDVLETIPGNSDSVYQMQLFMESLTDILEIELKNPKVQKLLKETKQYDLLLLEACVKTNLLFSHIFKAPVIMISSFGSMLFNREDVGMPEHPILYPTQTNQKVTDLTAMHKIKESYKHFRLQWYFNSQLVKQQNAMLKRILGPNSPSIRELSNNIDMLFLNVHPIWTQNVPAPPNVINVWGIYERTKKELSDDMKSFLDSSKNGVIYMSFGTNTIPSMIAKEKIEAFLTVLSRLPYDVLLKWDKDTLPGLPDNIRIGKWFPQFDLLRHPKVKLFITQGGLQSTEEAIIAGVPLIGVPMLGDQWYNVEKYEQLKIGKRMDIDTLSQDDVKYAIETVLADDCYRQNINKLRDLMQDEPEPALQRAIWWTEHVLRHKGAKHLRASAANISWWEYYEMPLVISLLILIFSILLVLFLFLLFLVKRFLLIEPKIKRQ